MAENHEPGKWDAVVCSGFAAVNVLSSTNVEELGWDYTEMELDPTGTCGLFDGMLLDWDDDTPEERREHEEFFPDAFTVGARILADDWDHEIGNDEVRSRCFLIIEDADQFTDHDTGRDWLHFYFGDEPKPAPEFFRERHSKTRPIVCLETGESFMGNPAAARPLHVSPAAISQAVRYGSPVNGLHFYHGDEPKPAPEFFKPAKGKGGKSPAAIAAAAKAAAGNSAPGTDYREHGIQRDRRAVQ